MKKFLTLVLVLMLSVLPLAGCGIDESVIRVNEVTHSIFYAPQYLAMALGYFEDEGIKIELTNGGGADKSMSALLSGQADVGLMGPEAAIYVYLEGKDDHAVVFGQLTKRDGSFLVGRKAEPNFNFSGMAGKEVIMGRRGGVPAMTLQYVLNNNGYNSSNITMNYSVEFNLLGPAFVGGVGDYVAMFEPAASELVASGNGYIVASIGAVSGEVPYTAYMATKSYVKKNSAKLEKFLTCINKATMYLLTHDNNALADLLMPYFSGSSKSSIVAALASYRANDTWMAHPAMKAESFAKLQDIMQNAGELSTRAPFEKVVDNSIANKISK